MSVRLPDNHPHTVSKTAEQQGQVSTDPAEKAEGVDFVNRQAWRAEQGLDRLLDDHQATSLGGATPPLAAELIAGLERDHDTLLAGAPTQTARGALGQVLGELRGRAAHQLAAADQVHALHARVQGAEAGLALHADLARRRPEQAAAQLNAGLALLEQMGQTGTRADALEKRTSAFRAEFATATLDGLAEQDPDHALARFDAGEMDGLWQDTAHREKSRDWLTRMLGALTEDKERERLLGETDLGEFKRRFAFRAEFAQRLQGGQATHGDLAQARGDGLLGTDETDRLGAQLDDWDNAQKIRRDQARRISQAIETGEALDASDPETLAAIDSHYEIDLAPHFAAMDPAERAPIADHLAKRAGAAPAGLVHWLRSDLLAGEPERGLGGARRIEALIEDPTMAASLKARMPADELIRARAYAEFADPDSQGGGCPRPATEGAQTDS